jgi:hypothetical protein
MDPEALMPTVLWPAAVLAAGIALGWVAAGRWQKASARALPPAPGEGMDHLRQIFEHATDGLFLIEVLGEARFRNLAINPALLQSMGMPAHQLVGRMIHETAVPSTATLFVDRYRRCVESGTVQREQISMALPAGCRCGTRPGAFTSLWASSTT